MFEGRRRTRADSRLFGEKSLESTSLVREFSPEVPPDDGTGTVPGSGLGLKAPTDGRLKGVPDVVRGRRRWEGMSHRGGAQRRSTGRRHTCGCARLAAAELTYI